ncbi:MAG: hypothetical protein KIT43_02735 [Bauldia sp.]|nr:hypothetical protein [Bauldia sp.]MCW5719237.1 hypothetical protein [Bauldia sp.]
MINFDVVLAGDFRFPGGTSVATAHEVRALAAAGYSVGLAQVAAPVLKKRRGLHPQIRDCLDRRLATIIPPESGEAIQTSLAIFHNPLAFTAEPAEFPRLRAGEAIVVAHQGAEDTNGVPYYDPGEVDAICSTLAQRPVRWAPISGIVRDSLQNAGGITIHDEDWHNTLFPEEWSSSRSRPLKKIPVVGRHSRADREKWPATRSEILTVYPSDPGVEVRLLGVGDFLTRTMGEFPGNWATFRFGEIEPPQFLKSIDFFVYYHHPHWVEAFGRTVAEALASGAVAILPQHFEATFDGAAVYARGEDAIEVARSLHGDWARYRKQSAHATHWVKQNHGPQRHVRFIKALGAKPSMATARLPAVTRRTGAPKAPRQNVITPVFRTGSDHFDVVTIGDMRAANDRPLRVAHEIRIQAGHGYRSGLIHVPTKAVSAEYVRGEVDACLLAGDAVLVTGTDRVRTDLVVVHGAEDMFNPIPAMFPAVDAARVIVVADRSLSQPALLNAHHLLSIVFRVPPVWAPISATIREALLKAWAEIPLDADNWAVSLRAIPWSRPRFRADRPVIAVALPESRGEPAADDLALVRDLAGSAYVKVLRPDVYEDKVLHNQVEWFGSAEIAATKVLQRADILVVAESGGQDSFPRMLVAEAMARGVVPVVAPAMAKELGPGAVGADRPKIREGIAKLDAARLTQLGHDAARNVRGASGDGVHLSRIERLTGRAAEQARPREQRRRIAFVSSNGVGLGHLTRLLSIARRLPDDVEPVFITMSQAFGLVEQFGYVAEYIPFHSQSEASTNADWNDWFRLQFEQMMDYYDVAGVVFDGGAPYAGLIAAAATRSEVFAVWVRRGMWRAQQFNEPLIRRQKFFDLIIEPRDIAGGRDEGMTAPHRGRVAQVDPIRLLDPPDILTRVRAAAELGLDPDRPAVLIQLGSGTTRDVVSITREVVAACSAFEGLQIVLIEWSIGVASFDNWPGITVLKGFPTSRYFNAFDFTIAAAGYNSYNEIISFGLPAIFVANDAPMMDDQGGRAGFAEEQGAALSVLESEIEATLPGLVQTLLDPRAREVMRVNCLRIALDNGAAAAAEWIAGLLPIERNVGATTLAVADMRSAS